MTIQVAVTSGSSLAAGEGGVFLAANPSPDTWGCRKTAAGERPHFIAPSAITSDTSSPVDVQDWLLGCSAPVYVPVTESISVAGAELTTVASGQFKNRGGGANLAAGVSLAASSGDLVLAVMYVAPAAAPTGLILQSVTGETTTDFTMTGTSLVDVAGATVTLTTISGSKLYIAASFSISNNSSLGPLNKIALTIDGTPDTYSAFSSPLVSSFTHGGAITLLKSLSAGAHTIKVQASANMGTVQCRAVSSPTTEHCSLVVMEIK